VIAQAFVRLRSSRNHVMVARVVQFVIFPVACLVIDNHDNVFVLADGERPPWAYEVLQPLRVSNLDLVVQHRRLWKSDVKAFGIPFLIA
jgi:hypothetical protein